MKKKTILIIDGQGGRLGVLLTERIKASLIDFSITVVGTNTIATAAMLRPVQITGPLVNILSFARRHRHPIL